MAGYTFQPPPPHAPDPDRDRAIDTALKERVLQAQALPSDSQDHKRLVGDVINIIYTSNRLARNLKTSKVYPDHARYREFYDQAIFLLFSWLAQAIRQKQYDPQKAEVLSWVNHKLKYLFIESVTDLTGVKTPCDSGVNIENLDEQRLGEYTDPIERIIESETLSISQIWQAYQACDPDGILQKRVTGSVTFQQLLDAKIARKSMRQLGEELGENQHTLGSVFSRNKHRFIESFRRFCRDHDHDI